MRKGEHAGARKSVVTLVALAVLAVGGAAHAQTPVLSTWNGLPLGDWHTLNWLNVPCCQPGLPLATTPPDQLTVPGALFNVIVATGRTSLSTAAVITSLSIGVDGTVFVNPGSLTVSTLTENSGHLSVNALGTLTTGDVINGGQVSISTGGSILAAGFQNLGELDAAAGALTTATFLNAPGALVNVAPGGFALSTTVVENDGEIRLLEDGSVLTGPVNLDFAGGGEVVMGSAASALNASTNLGNLGGHTIRGRGSIAAATVFNDGLILGEDGETLTISAGLLTNGGDIRATQLNTLSIDAVSVDNGSVLEALQGSTLHIGASSLSNGDRISAIGGFVSVDDATIDNTSGRFEALSGGRVDFTDVDIDGGLLQTDATSLTTIGGAGWVHGITTTGQLDVRSDARIDLRYTITNSGDIRMLDGARFEMTGSSGDPNHTTFTGGGSLTFDGPTATLFTNVGLGWPYTVVNAADHVFQGHGVIDTLTFHNHGLVDANHAGQQLRVQGHGTTNFGTLRGSGGGILRLVDLPLDNTGAMIEALDGSFVDLGANLEVVAGTLRSVGTGRLRVDGSVAVLRNPTLSGGVMQILSGGELAALFTVANDADVQIQGGGQMQMVGRQNESFTDLLGTGSVTLQAPTALLRTSSSGGFPFLLRNGPTHTIQGEGSVEVIDLLNQGLVDANATGGTLWLGAAAGIHPIENQGVLGASNGGTLRIRNHVVSNTAGEIRALDASSVEFGPSVRVVEGTLRSEAAGRLRVVDGGDLLLENPTLAGVLEVESGGLLNTLFSIQNEADIRIEGGGLLEMVGRQFQGNATYLGAGSITLEDATSVFRTSSSGGFPFLVTNGPQHTIRGQGLLDLLDLHNQGRVDANVDGGELRLGVISRPVLNDGTMAATGGGTLRVHDQQVTNGAGVIEAEAGSQVLFSGSGRVSGGTVRSSGDGRVRITDAGSRLLLENPTLAGVVEVEAGTTLETLFAVQNDADVRVEAGGTISMVGRQFQGSATYSGTGSITLEDAMSRFETTSSGGFPFLVTNLAGHTIQGQGTLDLLDLDNQGLIDANVDGGELILGIQPRSIANQGVLRASGGGTLRIDRQTVANAGGVIEAGAGSTVSFTGTGQVSNGELRSTGDGELRLAGAGSRLRLDNPTMSGRFVAESGGVLETYFGVTNHGAIVLSDGASIHMQGAQWQSGVSFAGAGRVSLEGESALIRSTSSGGFPFTLTQFADHRFEGSGAIELLRFDNLGLVDANRSGETLRLASNVTDNDGTLRASNGGILRSTRTLDNQHGIVEAVSGGTVLITGSTVQGGTVRADGGTIGGDGTIATALHADGRIAPGLSPGTLTVTGDYLETANNTLVIELESTSHDLLQVGGSAVLAGALSVSVLPDVVDIDESDSFTVLTAAAIQGAFSNVASGGLLRDLSGLWEFEVWYGAGSPFAPNSVVLADFSDVPEPSAALLLGIALAFAAALDRSRDLRKALDRRSTS